MMAPTPGGPPVSTPVRQKNGAADHTETEMGRRIAEPPVDGEIWPFGNEMDLARSKHGL